MGNRLSCERNNIPYSEKSCLISWDKMNGLDGIRCHCCNITLHAICEEIYRNDSRYCKCPHCQQIGTLYYY